MFLFRELQFGALSKQQVFVSANKYTLFTSSQSYFVK